MDTNTLIDSYKKGVRDFKNINMEQNEAIQNTTLSGATFTDCMFAVRFEDCDLSNAIFRNCNFKTCEFNNSDLTGSLFEGCNLDGVNFESSTTDGISVKDLYFQGNTIQQDEFVKHFLTK
jgi:uncharacterized protein YjbI with pentapeptide repeats